MNLSPAGRGLRAALVVALGLVALAALAVGARPASADPGLGHSFTINDVAQNEGTSSASGATTDFVFTVTLTNEPGSSGNVHVDYVTRAGTATEGAAM